MSHIRKQYELSVWEDVHSSSDQNSLKEQKICVIGSSTMESQAKAFDISLTRSTNGVKKLTFKLYKKFVDTSTGEIISNPFVDYLVNERKVKLFYKNKWHDFIVKQIDGNSNSHLYTYSLEDAFVLELSKNGFSVVLDEGLNNNNGTVKELAQTVLAETDWSVAADFSPQLNEESLVYVRMRGKNIVAKKINDSSTETENATFSPGNSGLTVLAFYSSCVGKPYRFQFIYLDNPSNLTSDTNKVISNTNCQYFVETKEEDYALDSDSGFYLPKNWEVETGINGDTSPVSSNYRGNRISYLQKSVFHSGLNRYVYEWKDESNNTAYGYTKTEYTAPILISNLIPDSTNHETKDGWVTSNRSGEVSVEKVYGRFDSGKFIHAKEEIFEDGTQTYETFIKVSTTDVNKPMVFLNSSPTDNRYSIDIVSDPNYILKGTVYNENGAEFSFQDFGDWDLEEGKINIDGVYEVLESPKVEYTPKNEKVNNEQLIVFEQAGNEYSLKSFKDNSQLKLVCKVKTPGTYYLKKFQLFAEKEGGNGKLVQPGVVSEETVVSSRTVYFNNSGDNKTAQEVDIVPTIMNGDCVPVYFERAEKIHSVSVKESNYFNILQTLAEQFEMWLDIEVEHNELGEIINKKIKFKKYIGKNNYAGFRYGVNLKDIQRTEISKNIVTKLIVKDNNNQHAENGFCTIARAPLNETKENTIYNFLYFHKQGLLDEREYNNYVYSPASSGGFQGADAGTSQWNAKGYFARLKNFNSIIDENNKELQGITKQITVYEGKKEVQEAKKVAAEQEATSLSDKFYLQFSKEINSEDLPESIKESTEAQKLCISYNLALKEKTTAEDFLKDIDSSLDRLNEQKSSLMRDNDRLVGYKKQLNIAFYKKYGRFIREGTWLSESHVDDNKYYIDAQTTLRSSCQPIASYSINVSSVEAMPGYETFTYELGDETFVEDEEFFGTSDRMAVVVMEITDNLDDPTKNTIKVQNFKKQFQDLFQKMAATVQQVNYNSGSYEKAAAFANGDTNALDIAYFSNALSEEAVEEWIRGTSKVEETSQGIKITRDGDDNAQLWLMGGRILFSRGLEGGGRQWSIGMSGEGISANFISTGILNVGNVLIMNGDQPAFRWDARGLSAYDVMEDVAPDKKFVRFDKNGIYGIDNIENINGYTWSPENAMDLDAASTFRLTWEGLKVSAEDGASVLLGKQGDWVMMVKDSSGNATFGIAKDGSVQTTGIKIVNGTIDGKPLASTDDISAAFDADIEQTVALVNGLREELQDQIDGAITSWFESGAPTRTNKPASDWIAADEGEAETPEQVKHEGDLYYDKDTGYCYRWIYDSTEEQHVWIEIQDTDIATALGNAAAAQATADGKMKVFSTQPVPPYQVGDLWAQGASGELLRCKTEKAAGENFAEDDWEKASNYTNDDYAKKVEKALGDLKATSEANFKQYANNFSLIDTSLVNLGTNISGVSSNLTTGLASADKKAQTYASNAKTGAESTAKGYANTAESNAKEAAQGYANTAESNAKDAAQGYANTAESNATTAAKEYAESLVGEMDGSVAQYLGAGGGTLSGSNYVISPYISGGYLNITSSKSRVIIDPHNKTGTGWIFQVMSGLTNGAVTDNSKTVVGFDQNGNAYFSGHITATSGSVGGFTLGDFYFNGYQNYAKPSLYYGISPNAGINSGKDARIIICPAGLRATLFDDIYRTNWSLIIGSDFGVTNSGALFAKQGKIGPWNIGTIDSVNEQGWANSFTNSLWARTSNEPDTSSYYVFLRPSSSEMNLAFGIKQETVEGNNSIGYTCTVKDIFFVRNNGQMYTSGATITEATITEATITGDSTFEGTLKANTVIGGTLKFSSGKIWFEMMNEGEAIRICDSNRRNYFYVGQSAVHITSAREIGPNSFSNNGITMGQLQYDSSGDDIYITAGMGHLQGTWTSSSAIAVTSDKNSKNTIENLILAYENLFDLLHPVRYKYNDGTSGRYHTGFIAQEVESALQEASLGTEEFAGIIIKEVVSRKEYLLRYEEFIALNTWQIQKLKPRMTAAEQEILQLKNEIQQLREEIENLKKS